MNTPVPSLEPVVDEVSSWSPQRRARAVRWATDAVQIRGWRSMLGPPKDARLLLLVAACQGIPEPLGVPHVLDESDNNEAARTIILRKPSRDEVLLLSAHAWGDEFQRGFRPHAPEWAMAIQVLQLWLRYPHVSRGGPYFEALTPSWREVITGVTHSSSLETGSVLDEWVGETLALRSAQDVGRKVILKVAGLTGAEREVFLSVVSELGRDRFETAEGYLRQVLLLAESVQGAFPS